MISTPSQAAIELLAHQLMSHQQWERAETLYALLLMLRPEDKRLRMALAYIMLERQHPLEALETLNPITKLAEPFVHFLRAKALHHLERHEESSAALRRYAAQTRRAALPQRHKSGESTGS